MLIDLLNSSNYIMVNMDAIRILGLNTAVYCAELLNILKKATIKGKLIEDKYFKIDRNYITKQSSIAIEDQLKCDANLIKINIIKPLKEDPDVITFDVETYASILASEDVKLQDSISKKVKIKNPKGTKQSARERSIARLKEAVVCNTPDVLYGIYDWIDAVMANPDAYLSSQQVALFKDTLDQYCNGDIEKAKAVLRVAVATGYKNCDYVINAYERGKVPATKTPAVNQPQVRVTEQHKTSLAELGKETF